MVRKGEDPAFNPTWDPKKESPPPAKKEDNEKLKKAIGDNVAGKHRKDKEKG